MNGRKRRRIALSIVTGLVLTVAAAPAWACGGLIGRNGAVNLLRTTTLAGYHDGVEHYVTSFEFAGGGGEFGSIVPLPAVPTKVERGGDWTLQRLVRETTPIPEFAALRSVAKQDAPTPAKVILETRIDALDITVLEGGAASVGQWAKEHGFLLTPDAPEVLDFYARRSPIFMAARFNAEAARARGQQVGDGTPIHLTIPTSNPWVPLRILGLGKQAAETVQADVYLLTDRRPTLLPKPIAPWDPDAGTPGLFLDHGPGHARDELLADLRADKGMDWIPSSGMWLTYLRIDAPAGDITYDLAVDVTGNAAPSREAAGLKPVAASLPAGMGFPAWFAAAVLGLMGAAGWLARRVARLAA